MTTNCRSGSASPWTKYLTDFHLQPRNGGVQLVESTDVVCEAVTT